MKVGGRPVPGSSELGGDFFEADFMILARVMVCWFRILRFGWPASFGVGWSCGLDGEFDSGSGRTLAACLTHASRAERPFGVLERRTGE